MNKLWRNAGLYVLLAIVVITFTLGKELLLKPPQIRDTWKYSRFIQEVKEGRVERVGLSADRTKALVTAQDGNRVVVNLPNDPEFINILTTNNVDTSVLPQSDESFWLRALSSLFFPILLVLGIFLLLRLGLR